MTRLVALAGLLALAAFVWLWPPGGLLITGVGLLLLALIRSDNEKRRAVPHDRRRPSGS